MSEAREAGLSRSVDRLIRQVGHWSPDRWAVVPATAPDQGSRADRVHALVQRLADRGADAEGLPRRLVPRLGDEVLPDQLRVVADDLATCAGERADTVDAAAAEVDEVVRSW